MEQLRVDAYSPPEIARRIADVATTKSGLDLFRLFVLAVMAGAFIGLGAEFYTLVVHDSDLPLGLTKLIGGAVFSLGLVLIVLAGAELFTGNTLMVMGFLERALTARQLLRSWAIVYAGNLVGSLLIVLLMYWSGQWAINGASVGAKALLIADGKVNLDFGTAFVRAVLCNVLVVLAVWLCVGARSTVDKIVAIIFPITAFVASGFEHCIANMYFIPMGMLLKGQATVLSAAEASAASAFPLQNLTVYGFVVKNLVPVTLGNVVGGSLLIGLAYWSVFLRQFRFRSIFDLARVGFRLIFLIDPRELSPRHLGSTLSAFYGSLSGRRRGGRPLPRDLSGISREEEEDEGT